MMNMTMLGTIRKNKKWSQSEMAKVLEVSRPTYIALEKGKGSLTIDKIDKLAQKLGCESSDILSENLEKEDKYKELLLEMLKDGTDDDGKITKTKLAKLIYLADFAWYFEKLESMTGAKYRKMKQGPVPNLYFRAIDDLFNEGLINIEINKDAQLISLSTSAKKINNNKISKEEKDLIKKIAKKWKNKRSSEIVAFTHSQLPFQICDEGEIIPYELITQQEADYVY